MMDIQQKPKSQHQSFNNAYSLDQFVPNYSDALANYANTPFNYANYANTPPNYPALQLAQAQAARLRALHSAVLNGDVISRDATLNPAANPVISPRNPKISDRLALVVKKNHGASANYSSTGVNRDHEYPVFVPTRHQSKETGRDSMGSNYSSESLMTPEERISYILDHDNKGAFPGLISANHRISANQSANHRQARVINHRLMSSNEPYGGRHTPIKALSEFLSEEIMAWRQGPPQSRSSDGLTVQSHRISANHRGQNHQKSVISDDPGLRLGANDPGPTNRVIKQISEIASGRSCRPSRSDYSNHNTLQRVPLIINHHRSEQSAANQAEIRDRIKGDSSLLISKENHPAADVIRAANHNVIKESPNVRKANQNDMIKAANHNAMKANPNVIKANHNVIKANHNVIKAAWLSIRGLNGGGGNHNHSRPKGHRSKSQAGEGDRADDAISTNHSHHGHEEEEELHSTNHAANHKHGANHAANPKHGANHAANPKHRASEAAMAMAMEEMEEMEARLMEAQWRRDMAIAEMEEVRKKMAMAMGMGMDRHMGMDMGMGMDRHMVMDMGRNMDRHMGMEAGDGG